MTDEDLTTTLKDWPYVGETYAKIAALVSAKEVT